MVNFDICNLLFDLCGANGTPGDENDIAEKAMKYLNEFMPCRRDALGSVIGKKEGKGINILLDAHMDRIGLTVTAVDDKGFLRVAKCGGADARVMSASEVTVFGKEKLYGVVTSIPPHLASKDEENKAAAFEDVCIDIGLNGEKARELVTPGDRIIFNGPSARLCGDRVVSPAVDDRAGMAAILRCLEILKESGKETCSITVMFSSQEETGGSGAQAGSFGVDADEAIAVDVGFALAPGIKEQQAGKLGGGAQIGFSPIIDEDMCAALVSIAENNGIKWQYDVMGGKTGTNGDEIQVSAGGVKTALISIPIRNMHTNVETVSLGDIEAVARLMAAYILERSGENA